MSIADRVLAHLHDQRVDYRLLAHPHTTTSQQTAEAAHVSGERLAKAVVLRTDRGDHLLAVLPASHVVHYPEIEAHCGARVQPAAHGELRELFPDCAVGAIPPFGRLYGLTTLADDDLLAYDPVYFEAGDHESVIEVALADFRRLLAGAVWLAFSRHPQRDAP